MYLAYTSSLTWYTQLVSVPVAAMLKQSPQNESIYDNSYLHCPIIFPEEMYGNLTAIHQYRHQYKVWPKIAGFKSYILDELHKVIYMIQYTIKKIPLW